VGLHGPPRDGQVLCKASYDVTVPRAGKYLLQIKYAHLHDRPVGINVNGVTVSLVFSLPGNGGWTWGYQKWSNALEIDLRAGFNIIDLLREGHWAHISAIKVTEVR